MKYIKGFDTLRGISILFVLMTHLGLYHHLPENDFIRTRLWLLMSGTTGVQIFFTLSGFLITYILLFERTKFTSINFKDFYARRFLRLLPPLVLFYSALGTLMYFDYIPTNNQGFFYSVVYLYNFVPKKFYTPELGHTWSLAVEEQYYLLWPFVVNFLSKNKTYVFIFLMLAASVISLYVYPNYFSKKELKYDRWFIPAVAPILIGSLFAFLINNQKEIYSSFFHQKNASLFLGLILFLFPLYTPILKLSFIFQSVGISIILVWLFFNQESFLTKILNNKVLSYIGTISYGLYVYQGLFLRTGPSGVIWIQKFPQNIILTFFTAILSYHLLEKPILKLKKKFRKNA